MKASDWDPVIGCVLAIAIPIFVIGGLIYAVVYVIAAAVAAVVMAVVTILQFVWQIIMGIVNFILAIPQPVWYSLFFILGIVACVWWTKKVWPKVQERSRELGDNIQKNPLVYLGIPVGCVVLLTCCAITIFAGSQLVNFIQQHVVIR